MKTQILCLADGCKSYNRTWWTPHCRCSKPMDEKIPMFNEKGRCPYYEAQK